jgi:putative addiction module component (TIGR02574 family)
MSTTFSLAEILRLSIEERIQLAADIWDSVAAVPEAVSLTEEQREELDRRLAAYEKNPDDGIPWEQFRKQLGLT